MKPEPLIDREQLRPPDRDVWSRGKQHWILERDQYGQPIHAAAQEQDDECAIRPFLARSRVTDTGGHHLSTQQRDPHPETTLEQATTGEASRPAFSTRRGLFAHYISERANSRVTIGRAETSPVRTVGVKRIAIVHMDLLEAVSEVSE
ncbi:MULTISPECIES: hypothetical protein [unclassified Microbacterium]|uniref:hypothetical protein n=1 Tax=unclassified Microbacterium TaxID=2609290 RepID=UPI00215824A6|nr:MULTISPECIES: hypothetical protein [unclassified Microbacterium]